MAGLVGMIVDYGHCEFIVKLKCPGFFFFSPIVSVNSTGVGVDKLDSWAHLELGFVLFCFGECDDIERDGELKEVQESTL